MQKWGALRLATFVVNGKGVACMKIYKGSPAARGVAVGEVHKIAAAKIEIPQWEIRDVEKEKERFRKAREQAKEEIEGLLELAGRKLGSEDCTVFEGWLLMTQDMTLIQSVECQIEEKHINAEAALHDVVGQYVEVLQQAEDHYMRERVSDLREVEERILAVLLKKKRDMEELKNTCVIVGDDLTPEQMIRLDRSKILAFVMADGSVRSHAAIMARIMGIPAIVSAGEEVLEMEEGIRAAVDGYTGEVFAVPVEAVCLRMEEKRVKEERRIQRLQKLIGVDTCTADGCPIEILANISGEQELPLVKENDAMGIGLFRSEWLFLERSTYPSEEMQFIAYRKVLESMGDSSVTIRTLDVGGDKKADYMQMPKEDNPALGYRGIRVCLDQRAVFKTQLRALYRASVYGNLSIMFPMITSMDEVHKIKQMIEEVQKELTERKTLFRQVKLGVMIETPAAALISDELAQEVDFFSIGTNDLAQYTLAVDRQNPAMEPYYNGAHRAVLKLLELAAANARKKGIKVCVCGELGGDLTVTQQLLDCGITAFSVNPSQVLLLKEKILTCKGRRNI